jgi:hypothetical protein
VRVTRQQAQTGWQCQHTSEPCTILAACLPLPACRQIQGKYNHVRVAHGSVQGGHESWPC